jgi:LysR family transcriptional regulator, chromosome initiation inhibitor
MSLLLPELEAFIAVVENTTVHGAAKKIGLSQTGVTQRIRSLEERLHITLFTRSRKGMLLTPEGKNLLWYCQRVQDIEGEALAAIHGFAKKQDVPIRITGSSSIMRGRIIPNSLKITKIFKNISLNFHITDLEPPIKMLKTGETDFAVMPSYELVKELDSKKLEPETYIFIAPYEWRKRTIKDIISNERFIDFNINEKFTMEYLKKQNLLNLAKKDGHYVNNTDALISMIVDGTGYSVLSKNFVEPYIKRKELVDLTPGKTSKIDFVLAWYPRREMPKYFKELIRLIN